MSVVDLADVKAKIAKQTWSVAEEAELQDILDAAEEIIEPLLAAPLTATTYTSEAYSPDGGDTLWLQHWPVASVASMTYSGGSSITLADLTIDLDSGKVVWNYGTAGSFTDGTRNLLVTYVAGGLTPSIKRGIVKLAAHMWDQDHGAPSETFGAAPDFDDLPNAVQNAISRYRRGPVIA